MNEPTSATQEPLVVVGAGLAADRVIATLRKAGDQRPITIVGDEGERPYERPELSKGVLQGNKDADSVFTRDPGWFSEQDVQTRFDDAAVAIDLAGRSVTLSSGTSLTYSDLVLATGARPRVLPIPGTDLAGVHTLRRISDSLALRTKFGPGVRVVVIGAGWIGLEVAAAAKEAGCDVTVLEYADVPLLVALGSQIGSYFADLHRRNGVDLRTGVAVTAIEGDGTNATGVRAGTELFPADLVVMGVGAVPNVELAEQAGLAVDNGVVVDDQLRADEHVYAVGDVANATNPTLGGSVRVEHWDNAIRQGRLAARVLLGENAHYDWQPYFYSDQFDLGMEYVGRSSPDDEIVIRGQQESGQFIVFWQRDGIVTAAMNVNIWDVNKQLRELLGHRVEAALLADEKTELSTLATG